MALAGLVEAIKKLKDLIIKQEKTITSLLIVVVVALLNELATKTYFKCPETKHDTAGWSFMIIPGIILAMLSILASENVSKASTICSKARGAQARFFCRTISLSMSYAVLALLSWIIATLLFTETFACIKLGPPPDTKNKTEIKIYNAKKDAKNSESKVTGLYMLLAALAFELMIYFVVKCILSDLPAVKGQFTSMYSYDEMEANAAREQFDAIVKEQSKANGERAVKSLTGDQENENVPEPQKVVSRDQIETLRKSLIELYPRLKNPLDVRLPYKTSEKSARGEIDGEGTALIS